MKPTHARPRPVILLMAHFVAALLLLPRPQSTPPPGGLVWNSYGNFSGGLPYDSGPLAGQCYTAAPWGRYAWGAEAASPGAPGQVITAARFTMESGHASLSGRATGSAAASVRYTQGTAWGRSACGAVPWNRPPPLAVSGHQLTLSLDVRRDQSAVLAHGGTVGLAAILWLDSPELAKPLALSLWLYNSAPEQLAHVAAGEAYHYQYIVGETPYQAWQTWHIPLNAPIAAALAEFGIAHAADTLRVTQFAIALELTEAEGAATLDNVFLRYTAATPPVQAETETPTPTATFPLSWETDVPTATPTPPVIADTATPTTTPTPVAWRHLLPLLLK